MDVRPKEAFAAAHVPGSINIPLGPNLPTWAGWVLPYDSPILIVPDDPDDVPEVVTHLIRVGLDHVAGLHRGRHRRVAEPRLRDRPARDDLGPRPGAPPEGPAATARSCSTCAPRQEWDAGHIEGAHHIHGGLLQDRFAEVPRDRPVAVVCGTGYRASIAASFLKRAATSGQQRARRHDRLEER